MERAVGRMVRRRKIKCQFQLPGSAARGCRCQQGGHYLGIGPGAKPDDIRFAEALPRTRSGKIVRRLLKQIASGVEIKGDITTLEDLNIL